MVSSSATTATGYLESLPPERRETVAAVRKLIRANLPKGYRETMGLGYNGKPLMYVALAAQKNNYSLYLTCAYMDEARSERLREAFARAGKKIDMGKSCIRFKSLDDLELDAIAAEIASTSPEDFIVRYEASR